jgi:hypothetical protein
VSSYSLDNRRLHSQQGKDHHVQTPSTLINKGHRELLQALKWQECYKGRIGSISGPHGTDYKDVYWDTAPCSLVNVHRHSIRPYCLHRQLHHVTHSHPLIKTMNQRRSLEADSRSSGQDIPRYLWKLWIRTVSTTARQ